MARAFRRWLAVAASSGLALAMPRAARAQSDEDYWVDVGDAHRDRRGLASAPRSLDEALQRRSGLVLGQGVAVEVPPSHTVRRGDTLWAVSGHYYGDPYEWPRLWSYNPEITNPHWIYPDQQLRLLPEGLPAPAPSPRPRLQVRAGVEHGTVFLREQGWLDPDALSTSGEIVGSPDEHMLLSPYDQVYIRFDRLPEGQSEPAREYTIYRVIEQDERGAAERGTLVRILGAVRIDSWDPDRRTARATIVEALDPIERGFDVAEMPRRFEVVPPVRSEIDLDTEVVATLYDRELVATDQIVFLPVGEEEGVRPGHRFFVVRAGDEWRREAGPSERELATEEQPPEPERYPDEVIAEARVVAVRPHSATLLVTRATRPIRMGDRAQLRRGY